MKTIIWLSCALAYGLIVAAFALDGTQLGGLPAVFLIGILSCVAMFLCSFVGKTSKSDPSADLEDPAPEKVEPKRSSSDAPVFDQPDTEPSPVERRKTPIKILIWLNCALVYGVIVTACSVAGIQLGGLPTVLFAGLAIFLARYLCSRVGKKSAPDSPVNQADPAPGKATLASKKSTSVRLNPALKKRLIVALELFICFLLIFFPVFFAVREYRSAPLPVRITVSDRIVQDGNIGNDLEFEYRFDGHRFESGDKFELSAPKKHTLSVSITEYDDAHSDYGESEGTFRISSEDIVKLKGGSSIQKYTTVDVTEHHGTHSGETRSYDVIFKFQKVGFGERSITDRTMFWYFIFSLTAVPALALFLSEISMFKPLSKFSFFLSVVTYIMFFFFPLSVVISILIFPKLDKLIPKEDEYNHE